MCIFKAKNLWLGLSQIYDVPRKVSSEEVSRHPNMDKSTSIEYLRKG
jgi:hypothetical protein